MVIILLINYTQPDSIIEKWKQKYLDINIVNLNIQTDTTNRFLSYKLLASRKENKDYLLTYTPDERKDIALQLYDIDTRIRNMIDTIEIV